jgi:hypothetical protein
MRTSSDRLLIDAGKHDTIDGSPAGGTDAEQHGIERPLPRALPAARSVRQR